MRVCPTVSILGLLLAGPAIAAQPGGTGGGPDASAMGGQAQVIPPAYYGSVALAKGQGKLIKLPRPVANLFVADDSIASVRPASPGTMFVFGKTPGETDVVATDVQGDVVYATDASYVYVLVSKTGTLTWARIPLETTW